MSIKVSNQIRLDQALVTLELGYDLQPTSRFRCPKPSNTQTPTFSFGMPKSSATSRKNKPKIAVTMGDPAGVGPELCLQLLSDAETLDRCTPIVFGDVGLLKRVAERLDLPLTGEIVQRDEWPARIETLSQAAILDLNVMGPADVQAGQVSPATGRASFEYIDAAIDAAMANEVQAIMTGPIHKEAIHAAGIPHPGHTEILAAKTGADRICMMLTSEPITCSLVTAHVGYADVPQQITVDAVRDTIELSHDAMRRIRKQDVHLIVCGLNPHAGEHGLFGNREEERLIQPAIDAARAKGFSVEGPLPPDTAFLPSNRERADCYVCMYHDQGLIPFKALAFDTGVNVTLGLSIIRTSVDHGTANDIAWQGKASVVSMIHATKLAAQLAQNNP